MMMMLLLLLLLLLSAAVLLSDAVDHITHVRVDSVRATHATVRQFTRVTAAVGGDDWASTGDDVWSYTQLLDHVVARNIVHACGVAEQ